MDKTFERSLKELEKVVGQLEEGELPLEQSLKLFEDGVRLARECNEKLTQAERRIQMLMSDDDGEMRLSDLDPASGRRGSRRPAVMDANSDEAF